MTAEPTPTATFSARPDGNGPSRDPAQHDLANERRNLAMLAAIVLALGSVYPLLAGSAYRGSADLHATIESTGGLLGLITGFALITRFYALGNRFHLFIGLAFFVNGAEDLAHGLLVFEAAHGLVSSTSAELKRFIPGTYVPGRLLLGLMLVLAPFGNRLLGASRNPQRETRSVCLVVFLIAIAATFLAFNIPLPDFIFPQRIIARPVDFLAAIVLTLALVLFLRQYRRDHHMLTWWISLAIGVNVIGQVLMSFSKELFDPFFDVAHVYKVLGYAIPLLGFIGDQIAVIAQQKRTEQALLASEVRQRTVLDTMVDGLITINHRGRIESVNPAAERIFGYRKEEVLGKNISMLMPEPYTSEHDGYLARYLDGGEARIVGIGREVEGKRKDGGLFPMDLSIAEMRIGDERLFSGTVCDITDRKQAEKALIDARRQAEAASQTKSEFLANMSHELRTPMNSIIGFTHRVLKKLGDSLPPRELDALETVQRNGKHLLSLINDILDLSKIEAGRMELQKSQFDLAVVIREVLEQVSPLAGGKPVQLESSLPDEPILIEADRVKTVQIMTNLLCNGVKYTDEGTVTISASCTEDEHLGPVVRIAVRDTGVGIKPEDQKLLFRKFTQVDGTIRRRAGGTGLGLCIVQEYTRMHGGRIEVTSQFGEGSEFSVLLPLETTTKAVAQASSLWQEKTGKMPVPPNAPPVSEDATIQPGGIAILCVDDEPDALKLLHQTLDEAGYNVLLADEYDGAMKQAQAHRPDLICLDLCMPGKDGYELLDELRSDPRLATVPVVVVSGTDEQSKALDAGAKYFLTKPVTPERLLAVTRQFLTGADLKVLVVEDDPDTSRLLTEVLGECNADVRTASNGEEGLAQLAQWTPSVIVLDLTMPVMDGYRFLEHVQFNPLWSEIPVVVLTAKTLESNELARLSKVTQAILTKGHGDTEQLIDAILKATPAHPAVPEEVST